MSSGKDFEHDFRDSAKKQGLWVFRINDTFVKAKEYDPNAFVPQQPCDYLIHQCNHLWMLELKSTEKKYITIERDDSKGMIKKHQYEQMYKYLGENESAAMVLQFQRDTEEQMTYFMDIKDFYRFLENCDKKSINRLDVVQYGAKQIEQAKVRKHWCYNVYKALSKE